MLLIRPATVDDVMLLRTFFRGARRRLVEQSA
jgi:hypothetical protein